MVATTGDIEQRDGAPRRKRTVGRKRHGFRPNRAGDRRVSPKPSLYDPQVPGRLQVRAELRTLRLTTAGGTRG